MKKVIRSETELALAVYRTQLFNPGDLDNVKKVQAGYKAQPLSAFLDQTAPNVRAGDRFHRAAHAGTAEDVARGLQHPELHPAVLPDAVRPRTTHGAIRQDRRRRGEDLRPGQAPPELKTAIERGIADAWVEFGALQKQIDAKKVTSGDLFGTREFLKNNYLYRMAAAVVGIYGNSKEEAMYPVYAVDADGRKLDGANRYTLRFAPGQLPPVNAFWSLTMYEMPSSLLVANPIDRYLINSPMLPQLNRDADGGLTLLIQNESPGEEKETNWLPAPKGPFAMAMRLYWPKPAALSGKWTAPPLKRAP